ncbi:RidA family protein [Aquimarina gracilis]|uniref:RidA family protein n=1 Tax=Aquimarina gracilis TaxID=874422 RepID=A0ABU5ZY34_9FLAO|nr:RidA family protein [Aquimarina gracilis]MEB3346794.1 RidA family protein [Aquimarina gracilis]
MKNVITFLCTVLVLGSCNTESSRAIFHKTHEPKKSEAPFSDAVQVGNLFFLSGQVGMDHNTRKLVPGGIKAETTQTLENIKSVLEHHDMQMKDVVKCTVILSDIDDFSAFNAIYKTYFPQKPARTTFAAKGLAVRAKIEIECIAVKQ